MEYWEKLRDPRWQKKRVHVFDRDKFICQMCKDANTELHIHHLVYMKDRDPWDYPDTMLVTLCKNCHAEMKGVMVKDFIVEWVFTGYDLQKLYTMIQNKSIMSIALEYENPLAFIYEDFSVSAFFDKETVNIKNDG